MFSLLNLELNLQQTDYILPTIPETCSYYTLRNQEMLILVLYKHNKCNFNTTTRQIYLFKLLGTMATIFQVYQTKLQNIDKLKQQLIHVWYNLEQSAIDNAITLLTNAVCDFVPVSIRRGIFWTFCVIEVENKQRIVIPFGNNWYFIVQCQCCHVWLIGLYKYSCLWKFWFHKVCSCMLKVWWEIW
jgi:hypothetical protein